MRQLPYSPTRPKRESTNTKSSSTNSLLLKLLASWSSSSSIYNCSSSELVDALPILFNSWAWIGRLNALVAWRGRVKADEKQTWTNSGGNCKLITFVGRCWRLALCRATLPSSQQVTSRSPVGEYLIALIGFLKYRKFSHTQVFSISNTRIWPVVKPQENIGNSGWAATHRG